MNLTKILAALLVVLAIGLGFLAWMLGKPIERPVTPLPAASAPAPAAAPSQQHAVVVAAQALAAGQRIGPEHVKLVQLPGAVADSFDTPEAVLGRTTLVALTPDAPVFRQQLLSGLALQVEQGQRAVAIAIKEQMAAGNHVRPGDFVDVFFTLDGRSEQAPVEAQTRLLLARSRVLAYGGASVERPPVTAAERKAQKEQESGTPSLRGSPAREESGLRPENAQTAVLAVPLEDVERLTLAEKHGQLTLALRHPDDTAVPDPALFAALPTALRPVAGRLKKGESLQPADRSYAGLRIKDLATGGDARNIRQPAAPMYMPAAAAPGGQASREKKPGVRQQTVELHNGAAVQTVNY
ncbi:Flp pilus assembly protein CpaB [Delftia acidovorans]|uniref:Flp pilus assembly protein CpaB n=1 Tax=Delftia acidovorans TaxID=80866 RepID=UPI003D0D74C2